MHKHLLLLACSCCCLSTVIAQAAETPAKAFTFAYVWTDQSGRAHSEQIEMDLFERLVELESQDKHLPNRIFRNSKRLEDIDSEMAVIVTRGVEKEDPVYWNRLRQERQELRVFLNKHLGELFPLEGLSHVNRRKITGLLPPDPANPIAPHAARRVRSFARPGSHTRRPPSGRDRPDARPTDTANPIDSASSNAKSQPAADTIRPSSSDAPNSTKR